MASIQLATPADVARAARRFRGAPDSGAFADHPGALCVVARSSDGALVGWAWGYVLPRPDGASMAYLHELEVAEEARRRGIGGGLLDAFHRHAREAGASKAFLVTEATNAAARALYRGRGGTLAGEGLSACFWWALDG